MWSRKSALLGSMAVAMYLLGLTLRNSQLVTIAVVIFVFLTWAALFGGHADVASSGRRADEWTGEEGVALGSVLCHEKTFRFSNIRRWRTHCYVADAK